MFNQPLNRWWTVVAGILATTLGAGTVGTFMFGIFAKAIGTEYGWPRTYVSLGLTAFVIGNGIGVLFIGAALDKWGVRPITMALIAGFGAAIAAVALMPPNLTLFIITFAVIGFCGAAATMIPYAVAICALFDSHRGLALGLVNAGNGIGGILMPLIAVPVLEHYGWRAGYIGFGLIFASIPLLALAFLVRLPRSFGTNLTARAGTDQTTSVFQIVRKNRHFWLLATAVGLISFSTFGVMSQMVPILTDAGFSAAAAAGVLAVAGTSSLCARLGVGYFLDRIFAPYVAATIFLCAMLGIWLISQSTSMVMAMAGAIMLAIGLGAEGDLITFLVSRYFPIHSFGRVTGIIWMAFAWGGAAGTFLLSKTYDATKSYSFAIYGFIALIVLSIGAILLLGPYIYPPARRRQIAANEVSNVGEHAGYMSQQHRSGPIHQAD